MLTLEKYLSNIPKPINKACWNNYHNIRVSSTEHSTCLARPLINSLGGGWRYIFSPDRWGAEELRSSIIFVLLLSLNVGGKRSVSLRHKDRNTNINLHVATHPWTAGSQRERQPTLAIELCDVAPVTREMLFFFSSSHKDWQSPGAGGSWEVELIIVALRLSFKDKIFQQLWHCSMLLYTALYFHHTTIANMRRWSWRRTEVRGGDAGMEKSTPPSCLL